MSRQRRQRTWWENGATFLGPLVGLLFIAPFGLVSGLGGNPMGCCAAIVGLGAAAFLVATHVVATSGPPTGICERCGYDLRGSRESATCPECGEPIPERD